MLLFLQWSMMNDWCGLVAAVALEAATEVVAVADLAALVVVPGAVFLVVGPE
jgi:hypothetical protein